MDAEDLEVLATVITTEPTGIAVAAGHQGFDHHHLARGEPLGRFQHLTAELVSGDDRIGGQGIGTTIGINVTAAKANVTNLEQGLILAPFGTRCFLDPNLPRFGDDDPFHTPTLLSLHPYRTGGRKVSTIACPGHLSKKPPRAHRRSGV